MLKGHGGNPGDIAGRFGIKEKGIIDFSASINPFLERKKWLDTLKKSVGNFHIYPDPHYRELRKAISKKYKIPANSILPGNGSTELLYQVPQALKCKKALIVSPSYADYEDACRMAGTKVQHLFLKERENFLLNTGTLSAMARKFDLVIIGNPNNPTGTVTERLAILKMSKANPKTFFLIDEAFIDFLPAESLLQTTRPNLVILRSLTKFYGIPGLRIGFAVSAQKTIKRILAFARPWSVNCVAEAFTKQILKNRDDDNLVILKTLKEREYLYKLLEEIKTLKPYPGAANFILVRIRRKNLSAKNLQTRLVKKGMLIRDCTNFRGLDKSFFRLSVRNKRDNTKLVNAIKEAIE